MVDYTRWDSADVLANGVLNRPVPKSNRPPDATLQSIDDEDGSEETLRKALLTGGINAPMYYGCWAIWKSGEGYDGELMQYRNVTGQFVGKTLDEAVEQAREWWCACYG